MKATCLLILCAGLILPGCSGPTGTLKQVPAATFEQVPSGYYRVVGVVKHPGLIKCEGESESLMTLISKAGGLNDTDYHRRLNIFVDYSGQTRVFKIEKVLTQENADPMLPCGATIRAARRME
jgi:protein involved in polysaccharide export with SLBB domain